MIKLVNLTPHTIVHSCDGFDTVIEPSGEVLRVEYEDLLMFNRPDISELNLNLVEYRASKQCVSRETECNIDFLLEKDRDAFYIVSNPVAKIARSRRFIAPDTSPESAIRDEAGNIVAVKRFCIYT